MQETWKTIKGFEGFYEVSNFGRIKSLQRTYIRKDGKPITITERILEGSKDTKGYLQVELKKDGRRNIRVIHRLVAEAFIENPEKKPQVNHKDGNKQNNNSANLEWVTNAENVQHAWKNGLTKARKGEEHGNHKLTDEAVRYIREHYKPHDKEYGIRALAKKFDVSVYPIQQVVYGKGWKHVS